MTVSSTSQTDIINPLPYVIIFGILIILWLIVLTWTLDVWYKVNQCAIHPNIWCSNNWRCNNSCNDPNVNTCFATYGTGPTGLAACLIGPDSFAAKYCFVAPTGGASGTTAADSVSCECTNGMQATNNCFSGCAANLSSLSSTSQCCCCPGREGCPWTPDTIPPECGYTNGQCISSS